MGFRKFINILILCILIINFSSTTVIHAKAKYIGNYKVSRYDIDQIKFKNLVNNSVLVYYDTYLLDGKAYNAYVIPLTDDLEVTKGGTWKYTFPSGNLSERFITVVFEDSNGNVVTNNEIIKKLFQIHYVNANLLKPGSLFDPRGSNNTKIEELIYDANSYLEILKKYEISKAELKILKFTFENVISGGINIKSIYDFGKEEVLDYLTDPMALCYATVKLELMDSNKKLKELDEYIKKSDKKIFKEYNNAKKNL